MMSKQICTEATRTALLIDPLEVLYKQFFYESKCSFMRSFFVIIILLYMSKFADII